MSLYGSLESGINKINLLKRFSLSYKLVILAISALGLSAFLLNGLLQLGQENYDFSAKERAGTDFILPIYKIIKPTQIHRGSLNAYLNGNTSIRARVDQSAADVTKAINELKGVLANAEDKMGLEANVTEIERFWNDLKDKEDPNNAQAIFNAHSDMVKLIQDAVVTVADNSNLTLDPELDSYYLMDITSFRAHVLTEILGQMRGGGAGFIASGRVPTIDERIRFEIKIAKAQDTFAAIQSSYTAAVKANAQLESTLSDAFSGFSNAMLTFLADSRQVYVAPESLDSSGYFNTGTEAIEALNKSNEQVVTELQRLLDVRLENIASRNQALLLKSIIASAVFLLLLLMVAFGILGPIGRLKDTLVRIEGGKLDNKIVDFGKDEVGVLATSLDAMQTGLRERIEKEREEFAKAERIRQALDSVDTNVMIADVDYNIIYMNPALVAMLTEVQSDFRKDVTQFSVDSVIGSNIDIFHKNPAHQRSLLDNLTTTHVGKLVIGGRHMVLTVNPIILDGERLGTVVEWRDRTAEIGIENEIDTVVSAAASGDFSQTIDLSGKSGFLLALSEGINQVVTSVQVALDDVIRVMAAMSNGNLTERIQANYSGSFDTLKTDINLMADKLTEIITEIRTSSQLIAASADEIADGTTDLSSRTEQQASSLEETAASMEEMTSTVRANTDNAKSANDLASAAQKNAQSGGEVVSKAVTAMDEINHSSSKISDIISVIDEIAFQTNLLALNAAVEAARAGDQGRGFAVVAAEVRNLAQRSADAAREIKGLIQDSVSKIESGTELVNESGSRLAEIVDSVEKVSTIMRDLNEAANEQTSGIEQVNTAVSQMDQMTQQNAALVEETSAAAEAMAEQAIQLNDLMAFFNTGQTQIRTAAAKTEPKVEQRSSSSTPKPSSTADDDWEEF
jgi:methyl-accepting chemotaxis protein